MNASRHLAIVLLLAPLALSASPPGPLVLERPFEFQLVLNGTQSWKSGVQATEATTKQTYTVNTRLRSNGFLYSDNLLDIDNAARMEIKPMYYARQGLERLRASNGGKLPTTPDDANTIFERYRQKGNHCRDNLECNQQAAEQIAAINAMQDNSREDLEAFLNSHGSGPEARFLYFFGYAGCPVKLSIQYALEITGTRAYDKKKEKPLPFKLIRTADSPGNEEDQKTLCEKYVATVDVKTGTIFVENLFVPAPPGTSKRTINTSTETVDEKIGLPPPFEALNWTSAKMRQTKESGEEKVTLPLTAALDGDNSVQGTFTGKLDVSFRWSFKPPAGKAVPAKP